MKLSSFLHFAAFGVRTILLREKKPILGTVIVTDRCNLKCRHCSVHDLTSVDHPYEQIRREMELLYHMGVRILFFCGGETFLWHDGARTVRDLVVEAKKMGFLLVNVVTNGTFPIDLPEADLILLEGQKYSSFPKIEVLRAAVSSEPVCDPRTVLAYVSDVPLKQGKVFPFDSIDEISEVIIRWMDGKC